MNAALPESDDFESLVADMLHGVASADAAGRLEAILVADPAQRAIYLDRALLHAQVAATPLAGGLTGRSRVPTPAVSADPRERSVRKRAWAGHLLRGGVAAVAVGAVVMLAFADRNPPKAAGNYDTRQLPAETVGTLAAAADHGPLSRTTLATSGRPRLVRTPAGANVELDAPGVFGLVSGDAGALFRGGVRARVEAPQQSYSVETANLRVVDLGTEFRIDRLGDDRVAVTVLDGEVEVQSRVRLPLVHWSFDGFVSRGGSVTDSIRGLQAAARAGVSPVAGLVGTGAAAFDNSRDAVIRVLGGTGEKVGTGLLSFSTGISIEALVVSSWSGRRFDYDEIWRKEDGNSRVLLAFQNDGMNHVGLSVPRVEPGPCLAFGLQLASPQSASPRYDELDMPLDGRDGRPTLAELTDGRPHHIVATYDSFTGRKVIYVDGRARFEHVYPVGAIVVSGGPAPAEIGNYGVGEPFTGTIDELSLYDFALTAAEVAEHHRRLMEGRPAIPAAAIPPAPAGEPSQHWRAVTRLVEGQTRVFNQHSGLPAD